MSLFPGVAKNTFSQGAGRAGSVAASLLTTALLTRLLGVSGYGDYIFILSFIMFFVAIADWGTSLIFVRESVKKIHDEERFFGNAFLFRLGLAFFSLLLINLLVFFVPSLSALRLPVKLASMLLLLISAKTSMHIVFQSRLKFHYLALSDLITSFSFLSLIWVIFGRQSVLSLPSVIIALIASNLLGTLFAIYFANKLARFNFHLDREILKRIFLEAMPTGALLLIFSIYNRLDILLLQALKGSEPVGIYGLAYKVYDNLILGAAYLTASLFPIISRLAISNPDRLKLIYRRIFDLLLFSGLAVLIGVLFLAPLVIQLIGGEVFSQSVLALRILSLAAILSYLNHLTGYTLIALGKQRVSLIVAAVALVWNLGLNLIFIPQFSYLAASAITIATEGLVFALTSVYLARKFSLSPSLGFVGTIIDLVKTKGKIF